MDSLPARRPRPIEPAITAQFDSHCGCPASTRFEMANETPSHETTFGYLSVINSAEHGYFGGYLIVGPLGRPLEFHCTAPVRPSRAQQILYGPTLEPFLLGEQIAGAMLDTAKLKPSLILANCEATLHARSRISSPMVLMCENAIRSSEPLETSRASTGLAANAPTSSGPHKSLTIEAFKFILPIGFESDRDVATRLLAELVGHIDLAEPFGRIEEAIREAQRLGNRGVEAHDQAA
jgi:hypothetical protein